MNKYIYNDCFWANYDGPCKVYSDSIEAINRVRSNMTDAQLRRALTQLKTGLVPDGYSQLCDRKASNTFQG